MHKVTFGKSVSLYPDLRNEVNNYFKETNTSPKGNFRLYFKTILLYGALFGLYTTLVFFTPASVALNVLLCMLFGANIALIGFNIAHDASHDSYSNNKTLNKVMAYSFDLLGVTSFLWRTKHNVLQHTFTNIDGMDSDIIQTKLLRLAPTQKKRWVHQYQHLYCTLLYSVSYIVWVFYNDFVKYFKKKVHNTPLTGFTLREHLIFWSFKTFYVLVFFVVPILFVQSVAMVLVGYLIMGISCGFLLGMTFQLAHVVEITDYEDASKGALDIENEWAAHQIETTANFAPTNKVVTWLLGGLNYQVEHHLFPNVSHVHYPRINRIVKSICARYQLQYNSYPSLISALRSHFKEMKYLGNVA